MNGCVRLRSKRTSLLSSPVIYVSTRASVYRYQYQEARAIQIGHDHRDLSSAEVERAMLGGERGGYRHLIFLLSVVGGEEDRSH
jgi:hypothetical protein